ncbi:hypothetical protein BUM88_05905 [Acinetobacter calcoaceticus]|uniref:hypothetical protein n=1 Tax=Acinetobacter calcoaceticus TaxID=471 RepID=UPI0009ABF480|nr:hypothetical protein [Acinetobacter calcoaceticus]AQZ81173.1 hypothetical protein BUM88_05905 [Acinetobacter calcoaceticus]
MDICIGGIFNGQKIENNNDFFKVEEHYSDHSSKYIKQHFHLFGQIFTFWVCEDVDLTQAISKAERILKKKRENI